MTIFMKVYLTLLAVSLFAMIFGGIFDKYDENYAFYLLPFPILLLGGILYGIFKAIWGVWRIVKKKIKDLTYDEFLKLCQSCHQDYSTGECVGCPFWKFRSVDDTCTWIHNIWEDFNKLIEVLNQEIEVEE